MKQLAPPPAVLDIAATLESAGHEAWCVGGAVRDALLGHPHLDWDLATSATPDEVRKLFRRTIPVGIDFGTIGVLDRDGRMHEVTTFRRDVQTDGRHAVVAFGASLDEDLARRDFTINAIAYSARRGELRDPFQGQADLARRLVRAVGEPAERMREDRLRALRALRFAARFGFAIDPATWEAIRESAPHLTRLSPERVRQELEKTMEQVARPGSALRLWKDSGALAVLVPALADLSPRVIAALDALPRADGETETPLSPPRAAIGARRTLARLTMLFIELDPKIAERALRALRFSNTTIAWVSGLVGRWRAIGPPIEAALAGAPPSDATLRRWVATAGRTRIAALLRIAAALLPAERRETKTALPALYRRALRIAWRDPVETSDLAVDGEDLAAIGIAAGPLVGKILRSLLDAVIDDPSLNTRDALLARAARYRDATP